MVWYVLYSVLQLYGGSLFFFFFAVRIVCWCLPVLWCPEQEKNSSFERKIMNDRAVVWHCSEVKIMILQGHLRFWKCVQRHDWYVYPTTNFYESKLQEFWQCQQSLWRNCPKLGCLLGINLLGVVKIWYLWFCLHLFVKNSDCTTC